MPVFDLAEVNVKRNQKEDGCAAVARVVRA